MINTRSASEKLALEGIKLTPEQIAQLAKQGVFLGAEKDNRDRWQIPESAIEQFILYKKRKRSKGRIWGVIVAIITVVSFLIGNTNDLVSLANKFIFNKQNPSVNSYVKIISITPERSTELSRIDLQQGIPIEIKVEYRNSLPTGYKQGEVNPFIVLSTLMEIKENGTSNWRELAKEENIFFGAGEVTIKGVLTQDYIRDDKITLSIGLRFSIAGSSRSYASSDGSLTIEYQVTK